ncbi:flagellar hook-associated protein FlgK [Bacillus sp. EB01]|uniref:flagellar hook-associated protein FlgK n=1 Tax=Bacillus sp. EB01 TaxID=1347086 RepID=UPI0005C72D6F|nr:flagellar hook-associated protein FlgK [Bacillus sp. EB01]
MASTFHGLEVGKRGLYAQQTALSVTGHNIANANTTGYTRQRAEMQASKAIPSPGMHNDQSPAQLGTGVEVSKIVRLREEYLDVQIRGESKNLGYWEAKTNTFTRIEELLNEPSDSGLAATMDEFWKGWEELSKNPDSAAARAVVRQRGVAVAETFQHISNTLDQIQGDLKNVIKTKESEINSLSSQIASLNKQISSLVPNNYQPNDLYDQRDVLIDRLSKLVNVNVTPGANGMVNVSAGNGVLVSGHTPGKLTIGYDPATGLVDPDEIQIDDQKVSFASGELLGHMESYGLKGSEASSIIPGLKGKMDELAAAFTTQINSIHLNGYNLNNINGSSQERVPFFTGSTAADIEVHGDIIASLNMIAAGKEESAGTSSTGNGQNAQEIANAKFVGVTFGSANSTADDFYRNIIGQLGIDSNEAQRMKDNSEVIIQQVENRRQSVSGVSLDEEMANMIKFQQAYNAAARYVTVMDQLLDKVINGMGRVGL